MKFGNSNTNENKLNRCTNYLTKSKRNNLLIKHQKEADDFKLWFGVNYNSIIEECKRKDMLNEDVVNDTFIRLYEIQLFKGCIIDYRSYYFRSYYTNYFQHNMKLKKQNEIHSSINLISKYEDSDSTHSPITHIVNKLVDDYQNDLDDKIHKNLEDKGKIKQILDYVYSKYPLIHFELFKIYIHCKPHISYKYLSEITGIKVTFISEVIKTIKADLKENKDKIISNKNS